jgi:hypothetical protein
MENKKAITKKLETVSAKPDVLKIVINGVIIRKSKKIFNAIIFCKLNRYLKNITDPTISKEKMKFSIKMFEEWNPKIQFMPASIKGIDKKCPPKLPY